MKMTGVIVHIRSTGKDYAMHEECAEDLLSAVVDATELTVLDNDFPVVIIGPLFAPESEWECAHSKHSEA